MEIVNNQGVKEIIVKSLREIPYRYEAYQALSMELALKKFRAKHPEIEVKTVFMFRDYVLIPV